MKFDNPKLWIAGLLLILLSNGAALLGVIWNRSGAPECELSLSQRELHLPYWERNRENSGISLELAWRIPVATGRNPENGYPGNTPEWLNPAKMQALGFKAEAKPLVPDGKGRHARSLTREVLVVLEMDGPTHQAALQQARDRLAAAEGEPDTQEGRKKRDRAREWLAKEERENSRLFAIDAGLDLNALRVRYPDTRHYAIVGAQVEESRYGEDSQAQGHIAQIAVKRIHLPLAFHGALERGPDLGRGSQPPRKTAIEAKLAFGKRLEPWIVDLVAKPDSGAP